MRLAVFFVTVAAVSMPSLASKWEHIAEDVDGTTYIIDRESVAQKGGLTKAWFQNILKKPQKMDYPPHKEFESEKFMYYFNCTERTSALVNMIKYAPGGKDVVFSHSIDVKTASFADVAPDTVGEVQFLEACKKGSKKAK